MAEPSSFLSMAAIVVQPESERKRRLLNIVALAGAITCVIFLVAMLIPPISPWPYFVIFGCILVVCLHTLFLNHNQYSRLAAVLYLTCLSLAIFASLVLGIVWEAQIAATVYYFTLVVLASGAILRPRAAFVFATLSVLLIAGLMVLSAAVWSFHDETFTRHVIGIAVPAMVLCYLMALLAWIYGNNLEGALARLTDQALELQEANEEIRAFSRTLEDRVEERTHELRKFVSMVAHDLRSPLTAISGYTEILHENLPAEAGEQTWRALNTIASNVEHMVHLTDDLLELSRLRSGTIEFEMEPMPIDLLIQEVCTGFERQLADKHLGLKLELPAKVPPVQGDPLRLAQVLNNLLGNACNYTPSGAIIVGARPVDGQVEISVRDTGIGIPPEEQKLLFTDFFRGEHELVQRQKGSGLGLSIAHSIIEAHGGKIWLESEVDKGTTVHFTLPVATGLPRGRVTDSASPSND
jgi:signal transduction histidine kinase